MKKLLVFITSLFVLSCTKNDSRNSIGFYDFPKTEKGKNKELIKKLGNQTYARQFAKKDDTIFLFDFESKPYIRRYDKKFNKIDSLGLEGDFNINFPLFQHFDENGNFIFINEGEYLSTYKPNTNPENPNSLKMINEIDINKSFEADGVFQAFNFKQSIIADAYYPKEGDLIVVKSNEINTIDFLIPVNDQMIEKQKDEFYHVLYRNKINVNPSNTLLVQSFSNFPTLQVFDVDGNRISSQSYLSQKTSNLADIYNNFLGVNTPNYVTYLNTFTTNKYIYALSVNETWQDILDYNYTHFEVHVFDWELTPLKRITIEDQIDPLGSFIVLENKDKKNEIIFLNPNRQEGTYYTKWYF